MVNISERWARNRTNGLQSAYFNGVGYESWENIWGIWNGFTPRDAEALRRIATIERGDGRPARQRRLGTARCHTLQKGVYASRFPGKDRTLWLLVNRTDKNDQRRTNRGARRAASTTTCGMACLSCDSATSQETTRSTSKSKRTATVPCCR